MADFDNKVSYDFNLLIRDEDGTVWVLGKGDEDRGTLVITTGVGFVAEGEDASRAAKMARKILLRMLRSIQDME